MNVANPPATQQVEFRYNRGVQVLGSSLNGKSQLFGIASNWVTGFEYYNEDTRAHQWNDQVHVRQTQTAKNEFNNNTTSLYGQLDLDINPRFRPTLGVRYDSFGGEHDNQLTGVKRDINDFDHISPKLGVRSALTDKWELRASAANGFALPSGTAKFDPNINVDSVEYWQYEVGINGARRPSGISTSRPSCSTAPVRFCRTRPAPAFSITPAKPAAPASKAKCVIIRRSSPTLKSV